MLAGQTCKAVAMSVICRLNAAEMFVDVSREGDSTSTNWVAESGVLDLFFLFGPTPRQASLILFTACDTSHSSHVALDVFSRAGLSV